MRIYETKNRLQTEMVKIPKKDNFVYCYTDYSFTVKTE